MLDFCSDIDMDTGIFSCTVPNCTRLSTTISLLLSTVGVITTDD